MRKMFLFMMASLDGYVEGVDHDLSWHHVDEEFNSFAAKQMQEEETILMGKKTYQLMESFWPTTQGLEDDPVVAELMNITPKVVVSRSLVSVKETEHWKNIQLVQTNVAEEIKKLKNAKGNDIIVLGSNNLCTTLLQEKLLDEIRIMINPVAIGEGTPLFLGIQQKYFFHLEYTKVFKNGNVLEVMTPVKEK